MGDDSKPERNQPRPGTPKACREPCDSSSYFEIARNAIAQLGDDALFVVPLGVLGPFSQWLGWPDWLREGTSLTGSGQLPQRVSMADDITITANFLGQGHGPYLIKQALQSNRLITGPTASIIIRNAPRLEDALVNLTALIDATNMNVALQFAVQDKWAEVTVRQKLPLGAMLDFVAAIRLILVIRTLERFLLRDLDRVNLRLTLPHDADVKDALLKLVDTVEMGSPSNRIRFPAKWLSKQNPDYDPSLWHVARQRLRAIEGEVGDRNLATRLRRQVAFSLESEARVPRLKEIAAQEGVTVRTLGRKLETIGVKFQQIVDRERRQRIEQMLADPTVSLADIARRTGYSNLSSFSRAFQQWYGKSPGRYRNARHGSSAAQ